MISLVAMQISDEWKWGAFDFVFAGALLFGSGLAYDLVAKRGGSAAYRCAVGLAVATALVLVWVNAAAGIIGDDEPYNLMYFGVLAVGAAGALAARLQPEGMARALVATAAASDTGPLSVRLLPAFETFYGSHRVSRGSSASMHSSPCCGSDRHGCFGRPGGAKCARRESLCSSARKRGPRATKFERRAWPRVTAFAGTSGQSEFRICAQ